MDSKIRNINLKIVYVLILFSTIGASALSINAIYFELSPYRFIILIILFPLAGLLLRLIVYSVLRPKYHYLLFFNVWVIYSLASLLWVVDYTAYVKYFSFLLSGYIATFFVFNYINNKNQYLYSLKIVVIMSIIIGMFALNEIVFGVYYFAVEERVDFYQNRSHLSSWLGLKIPEVFFGNSNNYALSLTFSVLFAFVLLRSDEKRQSRFLWFSSLCFLLFLLISTSSRSGVLGAIFFFSIYFFINFWSISIIKKFLYLLLFFFALIILVTSDPGLSTIQIQEKIAIDFSGAEVNSDFVRANLILNGLYFLYESFLMGVGLGQVEIYMARNPIYFTAGITNLHNWFIEILVSSGIIVFTFFVLIYMSTALKAYKIYKTSDDPEIRTITFGTCQPQMDSLFQVNSQFPRAA
jgi:teichuronic acid biosynthesis protein TuaE